jgi:hypothetical protein
MFNEIMGLSLVDCGEGFGDAGVRDDDVEGRDVVFGSELRYGVC